MQKPIYVYKGVSNRKDSGQATFGEFIRTPEIILDMFGCPIEMCQGIRDTVDKVKRNELKRQYLPAVDISPAGYLSIDIDNISDQPSTKQNLIAKLCDHPSCSAVCETISGNLVAYFPYECAAEDFKFLYYKIYLELTLLLSVNIDFLPEIGRLRYVSFGTPHYVNEEAVPLTEILKTEKLPYINTSRTPDGARRVVYGSR